MSNIPHILGSDSITVFLDGKPYPVNKQAHTYQMVLNAIKDDNVAELRDALDIRTSLTKKLTETADDSRVTVTGDKIYYDDREVTGLIASRIFEVLRVGLDVKPMIRFLENLMSNPSKRAVDELFGFLEVCTLPITSDGHFLAYKRVRSDYKDCHSGTMDNSVGQVLEMPRNAVDEDRFNTCSYGLHFCSYSYLKHFGGERIVVLKINPADVVAIPADYNNAKGRTCRYEVVDELEVDGSMPRNNITDDFTNDYDDGVDYEDDFEVDETDENTLSDYECDDIRDDFEWLTVTYGYSRGEALEELANDWGVSEHTIAQIVAGDESEVASDSYETEDGRLTDAAVREIRRLCERGDSLKSIGEKYGRSARTVARIRDFEAYHEVN